MRRRRKAGQNARSTKEERPSADGGDDLLVARGGSRVVERFDELKFLGAVFAQLLDHLRPAAGDDQDVEIVDFGNGVWDQQVGLYGHALAEEDRGGAVRLQEHFSMFLIPRTEEGHKLNGELFLERQCATRTDSESMERSILIFAQYEMGFRLKGGGRMYTWLPQWL